MCVSCHLLVVAERRLADGDTVGFGVMAEQLYEIFAIFIIIKNYPLLYASVDDVVVAWYFDAGFVWHAFSFAEISIAEIFLSCYCHLTPIPSGIAVHQEAFIDIFNRLVNAFLQCLQIVRIRVS